MTDLVAELEERARQRFVRWDPALWQRVLDGPARALAGCLSSETPDAAQPMLESYLRLASEAIGLGYLFPPEVGEGFLNHAFFRLLPEGLAALPAASRAQALAECWNLGENLEHSPPWWRRMFVRLAGSGASLGSLRELVGRAEREAFGAPAQRLESRGRGRFVDLGAEDRAFLPGRLHFLAPTVLCVHHADSDTRHSQGVWLVEPPVVLGPTGCRDEVPATRERLDLVETVQQADPCTAEERCSAANDWRMVFTLRTSQFVVAVYPG